MGERDFHPVLLKNIVKAALVSTPIGAALISSAIGGSANGPSQHNFDFLLENVKELSDEIYFVDINRGLFVNVTGQEPPESFFIALSLSEEILLLNYDSEGMLNVVNLNYLDNAIRDILNESKS